MDVGAGQLLERVPQDSPWIEHVVSAFSQHDVGLHLAVFAEPFLSLTLRGEKTIESRFSRNRCAPFDAVGAGDVILMKAVGGPICGLAIAKQAWFFDLAFQPLDHIRSIFGKRICAGDDFWAARRNAAFASLIELADPIAIAPLACAKRDRRGWVTLRGRQLKLDF